MLTNSEASAFGRASKVEGLDVMSLSGCIEGQYVDRRSIRRQNVLA